MKTLVVFIALVATIHTKPNLVLTPYPQPPTLFRNILSPSYYIVPSVAAQAIPSLNAATHGKSAVCVNNLKEAVPCAHTSKDDAYFVETRALCAITLSDYDTKFTDESKEVLQEVDMYNIQLVKDEDLTSTLETIEWQQAWRCGFYKCSEHYRLVDYYQSGDRNSIFKVFIHHEITPPKTFHTSGYNGKLHFGSMYTTSGDGAVFFVIHDNSLGPYVHHFKTDTLIKYVHKGLSAAAGAALGSIVPGLGTVIGGIVGGIIGASGITDSLINECIGEYLRYIG